MWAICEARSADACFLGMAAAFRRAGFWHDLQMAMSRKSRRLADARKFFESWRAQLKWQCLKPFEKFAAMIERHWDGIAAYCRPENKVALGFVEGLNN